MLTCKKQMNKTRKSFLPKHLTARLTIVMVLLAIGTSVAAGFPAFWIINSELESRSWQRITEGGALTEEFLASEEARLHNLAVLTSERPTLIKLVSSGDTGQLIDYLSTYQAGADLDLILIQNPDWSLIDSSSGVNLPGNPTTVGVEYQVERGTSERLFMLATTPIYQSDGTLIGYVTLGIAFDSAYVQQIDRHTSFRQSVIVSDHRTVSSLMNEPQALNTGDLGVIETKNDRQLQLLSRYYSTVIPISNLDGAPIAWLEIALPVDTLLQARQRALGYMLGSSLIVALIASAVGILSARRISDPVRQLTDAVQNSDHTSFNKPIQVKADIVEIQVLGSAFEESRAKTNQMLEELSGAKSWLETLFQSVIDGIITYTPGGEITSFSNGAQQITGWKVEEVVGKNMQEILRPVESGQAIFEVLPGNDEVCQLSILSQQGEPLTLSATGTQLSSKEHAIVIRDITEEKAAQNLRSYFLANITHEFRTPLAALKASVELLLLDGEQMTFAEISELLHSIHYSISGLETLIDNLLESVSIEANRFKIRPISIDLQNVVEDGIRVVKPLLDRRGQTLHVDYLSPIGEVFLDPQRISQVLVNLLSNASKFSPLDSEITLSFELQENDTHLFGSVADSGSGISVKDRENLFRQFVRLDSTEKSQYGVGLGLSVVKTIIEEHGGQVGVENPAQGGSIFWFTIPIKRNPDENFDRG